MTKERKKRREIEEREKKRVLLKESFRVSVEELEIGELCKDVVGKEVVFDLIHLCFCGEDAYLRRSCRLVYFVAMSEPVDKYFGDFCEVSSEFWNVTSYENPRCSTSNDNPPCLNPYVKPPCVFPDLGEPADKYFGSFCEVSSEFWNVTSSDNPRCSTPNDNPPCFNPNVKPPVFTPHVHPLGFAPNVQPPMFAPHIQPPMFTPYVQPLMFAPHVQPPRFTPHVFTPHINSPSSSHHVNLPCLSTPVNPGYDTNDGDFGSDAVEYYDLPCLCPDITDDDGPDDYESDAIEYDDDEIALHCKLAPAQQADVDLKLATKAWQAVLKIGLTPPVDFCSKNKKLSANGPVKKKKKKRKNNRRKKRRQNYQDLQLEEEQGIQRAENEQLDMQPIASSHEVRKCFWNTWRSSPVIFWVNIDGCYRKREKGGYGAILRDNLAKPIVAATGVSECGPVSVLYHQLQGVKRGLELAKEFRCRHVRVCTSSNYTVGVLDGSRFPEPLDYFVVAPILEEIRRMRDDGCFKWLQICRLPREHNRAADYLAKLDKTIQIIKPDEFPKELEDIIYEDANGGFYVRPFGRPVFL
ncbi:hypothetical protein BVC80_1831g113 [Macleaya cordata]|uniref:RNase H type-1 domain-containing protein n=1 Tax=Macleaya cordata TaxID=56857 RepID=A0A200R768_MACCD|nr:hypothetical protein BVC80_1831g113 [Macleaya cordata]